MDERDMVSNFDCDHNPRGSQPDIKRIQLRIEYLKTLSPTKDIKDELYRLSKIVSWRQK